MEKATAARIKQNLDRSYAGTITFPEIVKSLLEAGIERYLVDLRAAKQTYYHHNGEVFAIDLPDHGARHETSDFLAEGVISAIRASQSGQIDYPEFIRQIQAAGTVGYAAYLTGRQVHYFGAKGDLHIEQFPQ